MNRASQRIAYQGMAPWYDRLQQDIDPAAWADYLIRLDRRYRLQPVMQAAAGSDPAIFRAGDGREGRPLLLDLGCGTGSICLAMENRGYDPIGIDRSPDMLQEARHKAAATQSQCLFLQQDISRFELYGTVDLITCLLDTLNHLVRPAQAERLFRLCANYLNPGCLFIFDVGSHRHFRQTLGDNLLYQDWPGDDNHPGLTLFWQNQYREQTGISRSNLTFFVEQASGLFRRFDEQVTERYHEHRFLLACAKTAGLTYIARCGELNDKPPTAAAERHFYIFRRPLA